MEYPDVDESDAETLTSEDRLFVTETDDRMTNACLNFGDPEIGYVDGFRMAADLAVDHVLATGCDQDYLVYPIVFGYRQYLELRLKGLLRDSARLLDLPPPAARIMGRHQLTPLWTPLQPLLARIFGDTVQLELIGDRIQEFQSMDADSFAFRYATTRRGELSLPSNLRQINLEHLRVVMGRIAASLDGADTGLDVYLDNKAEMAEYAAEEAAYYAEDARADADW